MSRRQPLDLRGPLETLEIKGDPKAPTIVLFHGYGANAWDLLPLSRAFDLPFEANWFFPSAPDKMDNPFNPDARMWFEIENRALQEAIQSGTSVGFTQANTQSIVRCARDLVTPFIQALDVPAERLIVGGFSQGSMLALEWLLQQPNNVGGLMLLACAPIDEASCLARAPAHAGQRFIQTHARQDHILSIANARRLAGHLQSQGFKGRFVEGEGAHTIPQEALPALQDFLTSFAPRPEPENA